MSWQDSQPASKKARTHTWATKAANTKERRRRWTSPYKYRRNQNLLHCPDTTTLPCTHVPSARRMTHALQRHRPITYYDRKHNKPFHGFRTWPHKLRLPVPSAFSEAELVNAALEGSACAICPAMWHSIGTSSLILLGCRIQEPGIRNRE